MPDRQATRARRPDADPAVQETVVLEPVPPAGRVPPSLKDVSFSTVVRGYDRREVDAYVERVNGVIAQLEISHSPESAVKHALDRVGEQTAAVLQRAREAAEQLTAAAVSESEHATRRARVEAAETLERARADAETLRAQAAEEADALTERTAREAKEQLQQAKSQAAETRKREEARLAALARQIEAADEARRAALEDLGRIAGKLAEFAQTADAPQSPPDEDEDGPAAEAGR